MPHLGPVEDFHPSVRMLDQRRAALYPVAVVAVHDIADLLHLGLVDVAADNAVDTALGSLVGQRMFEIADELDRALRLVLQIGGERPVGIAGSG